MPNTQIEFLAAKIARRQKLTEDPGFIGRKGLSVLFNGVSGTGKTLTATLLAKQLNLPLYRVDLSGLVSKCIGETEKNLDRVFAAASLGGAVLFFDEADALFGRRTEVRDAHDRYANLKTNFLLQRMNDYEGVVILTTNSDYEVDDAFVRRIDFVQAFPISEMEEREEKRPVLQLNANDPLDVVFALKKAIKQSGLTQAEIADRLKRDYGVEITASALSHGVRRGSIRLQRALQILAICGVVQVEIRQV